MVLSVNNTSPNLIHFVLERALLKFGKVATMCVGRHFGGYFPFYYVVEYPKSGGTWLGKMYAGCLGVPLPQFYIFPLGFESVIHTHSQYDSKLKNVLYLMRDGRDVMVSYYFHRLRSFDTKYKSKTEKWARQVFGTSCASKLNDVRAFLPKFIEYEMNHPSDIKQNWSQHVGDWFGRPGVVCVKYEDLLADAVKVLACAVEEATGKSVDEVCVAETVDKFSFERMSGRKRGEEDRKSAIRKGVSGDWKNYFSREAGEIFNQYAGKMLVDLGYEESTEWIKNL